MLSVCVDVVKYVYHGTPLPPITTCGWKCVSNDNGLKSPIAYWDSLQPELMSSHRNFNNHSLLKHRWKVSVVGFRGRLFTRRISRRTAIGPWGGIVSMRLALHQHHNLPGKDQVRLWRVEALEIT
jgi:hypothetical protein